jgi:hypothetical protein
MVTVAGLTTRFVALWSLNVGAENSVDPDRRLRGSIQGLGRFLPLRWITMCLANTMLVVVAMIAARKATLSGVAARTQRDGKVPYFRAWLSKYASRTPARLSCSATSAFARFT